MIATFELFNRGLVIRGAFGIVSKEDPPEAFERFAFVFVGLSPLFFSHVINRRVEGLDDVETVEDKLSIGAVFFYGVDVGFAHITASPNDFLLLIIAEFGLKESVDGVAALALSDPEDARAFKIVDDGNVLVPFAVGYLIDTDSLEPANAVAVTNSRDGAMEDIREGGISHVEQFSGSFLGHQLGVGKQQKLESIGDTSVVVGPGDLFLKPPMSWAEDLFGSIQKEDSPSANPYIPPDSGLG